MEKTKMEKRDEYKSSRTLFIFEALIEYLVAILVGGAYLAKLTSYMGISDALTGILTSFGMLGCSFQLVAVFLAGKRPFKPWVSILHTVNQLFFTFLYLVPIVPVSKAVKTVIFIFMLLGGQIINYIINSPKLNWFMDLVDEKKRGSFTATKEIISLLGGMIFTFVMGNIVDRYDAIGNTGAVLAVGAITLFVLTTLHTLTLIFSKEKPVEKKETAPALARIKETIKNKKFIRACIMLSLFHVAHNCATPFYGSYQIKELGFSMTFVSILSAVYAVVRSSFSRPFGRFADKYSFLKMMNICYIIIFVAYTVNVFTVPANGRIFYTAYYALVAVASAGINSGTMNVIFECADRERRVESLALSYAVCGLSGFFSTLATSPLVSYIQKNGNKIFGISAYAQQVVSLIAAALMVCVIIYLNTVMRKNDEKE